MQKFFIALIAVFALAEQAHADAYREWWTSARAMGMGNAYTSVVRNSDAIFYNPAALARVNGFTWTALDPRVGADGLETIGVYQDYKNSSDLANFIEQHWGDQYWAGGGAKSAIALPNFGAAAFSAADLSISAENPANPVVNMNYSADYGFAVAGAIDLVPGIMSIGMTGKRITRVGTSAPFSAATLANVSSSQLSQELKNRGSGYGLDVGLLFTAPTPVKPSLGIVYQNLGYTAFNHEGGSAAPERIDPEFNVGASLTVDADLISITPAMEVKHLNDPKSQLGKKLSVGVEIHMPLIDIRAGLNQGYYALGAGFDMGVLRFDAATYGVELGEYPGQREDRRYMAQMTIDLGFDVGNFSGKDSKTGERSHLKRRR